MQQQLFLPKGLYVFFVTGGALLALSTTLNATFGWVTKPVLQACVDGWFPKKLGTINDKYGTPHYLLILFYIVGLIPVIAGLDIDRIANMSMILMNITTFLVVIATARLPKLLPEAWSKSTFKISDGVLKVVCYLCGALLIFPELASDRRQYEGNHHWQHHTSGSYLYLHGSALQVRQGKSRSKLGGRVE